MTRPPHFKNMKRQTEHGREFAATITPLASIFGSGFLVIIGVLSAAVGGYAIIAMTSICALAYALGGVIRFNIANVEPKLIHGGLPHHTHWFETASDVALVPAYVISVTLYLRILASFALGEFGVDSDYNQSVIASVVILLIWGIAIIKGLTSLETLEKWALLATLVVVACLMIAFTIQDVQLIGNGVITLPTPVDQSIWQILAVLGGAVIVVQGFETTRYLGEHYSAQTRIKANRNSQLISSAIYILFIAVTLPFTYLLDGADADNGLLLLVEKVIPFMAIPLVFAAVFSQFSAAVADTIGSASNIADRTDGKFGHKAIYSGILAAALILNWLVDTAHVLVLASKAFALYYCLQCVVAFSLAAEARQKLAFGILAVVMLLVTLFAVPVG